ncbi:MAG: hypothetical protein Q9162_003859 [Coniocarpon cinnabarinum]
MAEPRKRRTVVHDAHVQKHKRRKTTPTEDRLTPLEIRALGEKITESPQNYNKLETLLQIASTSPATADNAISALCDAFSVLIAEGNMVKSKCANESEKMVCDWLRQKNYRFDLMLFERLGSSNLSKCAEAAGVIMQLVEAEIASRREDWVESWMGNGYFRRFITAIVEGSASSVALHTFKTHYANKFDDVKYYTLCILPAIADDRSKDSEWEPDMSKTIELLSTLNPPSESKELRRYFHEYTEQQIEFKKPPSKLSDFKKQAQRAFSRIFASRLDPKERNTLLRMTSNVIVPWLQTPTFVLDFLADSFEQGGPTALLALSGLYEMMTTHNLDYPLFYTKLYSLLDDDLLHSDHRSRFFRMLDEFLSSSHLPAAMVASFIKRLSRLALQAPPAAVVTIVPFVYNMLQMHPTCTFMIHREPRTPEERRTIEEQGAADPFNMSEEDPMNTGAIDSCLWELETLQFHFHPNVASLAKIISQEFRKQAYYLEDFLDHSYNSLVDGDLGKEMKKPPVVEFEIPKQIFTDAGGDATLAHLMTDMIGQAA